MIEVASTASGAVSGELAVNGVMTFRGVPYATPPTGPLRWQPPRAPEPWAGVRPCRRFAPIAIQAQVPPGSLLPLETEPQAEDCLYLNVWTAAQQGERRPVIVWFHPGAYQLGSGSAALFDGSSWAQSGVVFVTFNHRLSLLGFLVHPSLVDELADGLGGNYGFLDQIAVLEWVQANIGQFGGDPGCVTIFGVSSGASSVSLLMASPRASSLFHRAIAESGGSFGPAGETTGLGDVWQTVLGAARSGEAWARSVGVSKADELRALGIDQLRHGAAAIRSAGGGAFDTLRPVVGGRGVVEQTATCFRRGEQAAVPLLVGCAAREELSLAAVANHCAFLARAASEHGSSIDAFLSLYPAENGEQAARSDRKATGHRLFTWQSWVMARLHAQSGHPTYLYRFEQAPPLKGGAGAFHGASIFYTFDRFELRPDGAWSDEDRATASAMIDAWVAFARSGVPDTPRLPEWPRFAAHNAQIMRLSSESWVDVVQDRDVLDFWDSFYDSFAEAH